MCIRDSTTTSPQAKFNKEQMTKGWSEFKKGDREAALRTWNSVYERNTTNGTGMRAKAYIAEALERDYDAAAGWYEKALRMDPADCMTLYNYGVLLELSLIHISEPTRLLSISYAVFCLKKKKKKKST
eukprot:TRINITY_DN16202_c0_g1_i1.p1 TRINITY_DN16202_c0_g1~~TRINITY_DN16202_c0_g1_i1.p1  ORF type:complete len:128 (+),score=50.54 TRINITY_DN16202_c0_g1_i1:178-561(+)